MGMVENNSGTPNAKTRTKHEVKLTKDQYNAILARLLDKDLQAQGMPPSNNMPMPGMMQEEENPYLNLPLGGRRSIGMGMRGMPGVGMPNLPRPEMQAPLQDNSRIMALLQQLQGMQAPPAPGPRPLQSVQDIMGGM